MAPERPQGGHGTHQGQPGEARRLPRPGGDKGGHRDPRGKRSHPPTASTVAITATSIVAWIHSREREGQETRVSAGELTPEEENTEQGCQRRHDGGNRGVTFRDVAGGHGDQGDAPEEERRLVEFRLIPHPSGEPEPVAKRVLREQGLARLVGNPNGAAAHRQGIDDGRRAEQRHEQHALPGRQPSRDLNQHADISPLRGKGSDSSSLDVVATTVPWDACAPRGCAA